MKKAEVIGGQAVSRHDRIDAGQARQLLREAAAGRAEAQARGADWPDYEMVLKIAEEMEADASEILSRS